MTVIYSFLILMFSFVAIGAISARKKKKEVEDYLLASRSMKPWVVALAACATSQSGFMFTGMIGATYVMGVSAAWILIGFLIGDLLTYKYLHKRFRKFHEKYGFTSYSGLVANGAGKDFKIMKYISAILIFVFLGIYAAAQLTAGSKALHVLFGWDYNLGAILGAIMVFFYCFAGGIRASMWVNVAQSFVMVIAMGLLVWFSVEKIGSFGELFNTLENTDSALVSWTPKGVALYGIPYILGWVAAGLTIIGQPFVMVNYMTLNDSENMKEVRRYYFSWTIVFYALTILVGLCVRVLLPDLAAFDPEIGLPKLSMELLPQVLVGFVLAALFAGAVSTADSQIISCSTSLSKDICPKLSKSYLLARVSTIIVICAVLAIAIAADKTVFNLVVLSWGVLGGAFTPIVAVYIYGYRPRRTLCLFMMIASIAVLFWWRHMNYGNTICYEVLPSALAGFMVFLIGKKMNMLRPKRALLEGFNWKA